MQRNLVIATSVVALGMAGGAAAYAKAAAENEALADLARAQVTLVQAVTAAESHADGKAVQAELVRRAPLHAAQPLAAWPPARRGSRAS